MLHYSTVEPHTLDVLKKLMALQELQDFYLVGGTALSFYFGHRLSVDLDLFCNKDFRADELITILERNFADFTYSNVHNPIGLFSFIDDIKVDFVKYYHFPIISNPIIDEEIRLYSIPDIIAMKIAAILKRGVKKDFWDIAELLNHYSIDDFIEFYNKKFPNHQLLISIPQALTYFVDAEESEEPISLKGQTWNKVKKSIQQRVSNYLK